MFDNIGLADQAGSGFIRILDEWRELGYRKPTVVSNSSTYEFELDLKFAGMLSSEDRSWLMSIGGPWREEEELALVFARHDESVDNQTLRSVTGQHLFDASQTLRSLRDRGYLVMQGAGRNTRYLLGEAATGLTEGSADSDHLVPGTGHTGASTGHTGTGVAIEEDPRLQELAHSVAVSTRTSPEFFRQTILHLCGLAPLSSDELVRLLNRDVKTIRRYITALIASGELERVHRQRRHPQQRYRATQSESERMTPK